MDEQSGSRSRSARGVSWLIVSESWDDGSRAKSWMSNLNWRKLEFCDGLVCRDGNNSCTGFVEFNRKLSGVSRSTTGYARLSRIHSPATTGHTQHTHGILPIARLCLIGSKYYNSFAVCRISSSTEGKLCCIVTGINMSPYSWLWGQTFDRIRPSWASIERGNVSRRMHLAVLTCMREDINAFFV